MQKTAAKWLAVTLLAALVAGCGGGGGGSSSGGSSATIDGVASKGPIHGGAVKVYALNTAGAKGSQLGTTATTLDDGSYSINLGTYTGNVLVEVTGGTYTDEATGATGQSNPGLKAAIADVSGAVHVAVTPLTAIAVQYAGSALTKEKIEQANYLLGVLAGVDIISTMPANVIDVTASSKATVDQINYGLLLAAVSKMVANDPTTYTDISSAITAIKDDLSDGKLDMTGANLNTALTDFIADTNRNKSGVMTLNQTNLDDAITFITNNIITIPTNVSDLTKAKALVSDTRNTVLSIYNYQGVGVPGIMDTPFNNLSEELQTKIEPELTAAVDRISWIINSANYVTPGTTQTFTMSPYTLTITVSSDETSGNFTVKSGATTIDTGTLTLTKGASGLLTAGTFIASIKTATGTLDAKLDYTGTVSSGSYTSMTFTGLMTFPGFSLDFSQSGRKLYATFAVEPGGVAGEDFYPTSIVASARITTDTAQMDGSLSIPTIIWASKGYMDWQFVNNSWQYGCVGEMRPESGTFTGSFEEIKNDATTGVKFSGTISGNYTNASTLDGCTTESSTNFVKWNASFDGKIEAPSRPTITAFLKATQSEYRKANLDANYKRTNTDGTVVSLSGSGTIQAYDNQYGDAYNVLNATLTNQDGMIVTISNDDSKSGDSKFSGNITTSGGSKMADLYTTNDVPMVKYTDNYVESIF